MERAIEAARRVMPWLDWLEVRDWLEEGKRYSATREVVSWMEERHHTDAVVCTGSTPWTSVLMLLCTRSRRWIASWSIPKIGLHIVATHSQALAALKQVGVWVGDLASDVTPALAALEGPPD